MPCDYTKYPNNWKTEIVPAIKKQAGNRCEWCMVDNYAVGYREKDGSFFRNCGNGPCDASGFGKHWPNMAISLTYSEAREFVEHYNICGTGKRKTDDDGHRWIVIVLTVAHIDDPDPMNCDPENLRLLCQRCHNRHDAKMRALKSAKTREERKAA